MVRVFANGPRDLRAIPGRVIPKTQKMLNTQHYKVRIKWSNPRKGVAPSPNDILLVKRTPFIPNVYRLIFFHFVTKEQQKKGLSE